MEVSIDQRLTAWRKTRLKQGVFVGRKGERRTLLLLPEQMLACIARVPKFFTKRSPTWAGRFPFSSSPSCPPEASLVGMIYRRVYYSIENAI